MGSSKRKKGKQRRAAAAASDTNYWLVRTSNDKVTKHLLQALVNYAMKPKEIYGRAGTV